VNETLEKWKWLTCGRRLGLSVYVLLWCESPETNSTISKAKVDEHSIGRLRIIGTVSNSQDFAKAYNCPIGSAMNPERKCHIWK